MTRSGMECIHAIRVANLARFKCKENMDLLYINVLEHVPFLLIETKIHLSYVFVYSCNMCENKNQISSIEHETL